jgi:hypothetical protein
MAEEILPELFVHVARHASLIVVGPSSVERQWPQRERPGVTE